MKSILFLFLSIIFTLHINAQHVTEEMSSGNEFFIGGSMNFSYNNNFTYPASMLFPGIHLSSPDNKTTSFGISPEVGMQLNNHWALGLDLGYQYMKTELFPPPFSPYKNTSYKANNYLLGIFTRYVFNPQNSFNFFIAPKLAYSSILGKSFQSDVLVNTLKSSSFGADLGLGVIYEINENISILGEVGAMSFKTGKAHSDSPELEKMFTHFGFDFSPSSIFIGIEFIL